MDTRPGFSPDLDGDRPGLPRLFARRGYELGFSQQAMADSLGVSDQTLLNVRRNRRSVRDLAASWAALVGVDLDNEKLAKEIYYELLAAIDDLRAKQDGHRNELLMLDDIIRYVVDWDRTGDERVRARRRRR